MPINAGFEYGLAEQEYFKAKTNEEKLVALKKMLQTAPKHKSSGPLLSNIKARISKLKEELEKESKAKKSAGKSISIKKDGAARIIIVGMTNSGKSTLLKRLTNANVEIAPYPFTTKKPEVGIMDYHGIKLQIVEIPAIVKNFNKTNLGPTYLSLIRTADLIILMFNNSQEKLMLDKELVSVDIETIIYNNQENIADEIWRRLNLIKVYTKQPGKEKDFPPIAFKNGATIRDIAERVHKDFLKMFKYARVWGSAKYNGQTVGLDYLLQDGDIVELHMK